MLGLNGFPLQRFLPQKVWGSSTTWLLSVDFPHFSVRCCFPHLWLQRFSKMPSARDLQLLHVLTFLICLQFCFLVDNQRSVKILSFTCIKEALIWRVMHFWISRLSLASSCNLGCRGTCWVCMVEVKMERWPHSTLFSRLNSWVKLIWEKLG